MDSSNKPCFMIEPFLVTALTASTRASTATYIDALGILRTAAIDEIRPIVEPFESTNLITNSNSFSADGTTVTLSTVAASAPDGTSDAVLATADTSTGTHTVKALETASLTPGLTYGASIFVEKHNTISNDLSRCVVKVLAGTGTSLTEIGKVLVKFGSKPEVISSTGVTGAMVVDCTGNWLRAQFEFVAGSNGGHSNHQIRVLMDSGNTHDAESTSFTGSSHYKLKVFGADIEPNFASSYIPTTAGTVTRAADIVPSAVAGTSDLVSSNVPVDDYAYWLVGTAYAVGDKVLSTGHTSVYECLVANTGTQPAGDTTGKWIEIGRVNCWRMFDGYMSSVTSYAEEINVSIRPGAKTDSLVLFGVKGARVRGTVIDTYEGLCYDQSVSTLSHSAESSWYGYFFNPQEEQDCVILTDLPRSSSCTIGVQISLPGGVAECAMCLVGSKDDLGIAQWGLGFGIDDYSAKSTNAYGDTSIVERAFANRVTYQLYIDSADNTRIKRRMAAVRAKACVFVGDKTRPESIVYGYYKSFFPLLQAANYTDCNLEVEGLT